MDERMLTADHEAGHAVAVHVLGGELRTLTCEPGRACLGAISYRRLRVPGEALAAVRLHEPFCSWPAEYRAHVERELLILLAGDIAEWRLRDEQPGPAILSAVAALSAVPPVSEAEHARARASVDTPGPSDREMIAELAHHAHGDDWHSVDAWRLYLAGQAAELVAWKEPEIRALAAALSDAGTLAGAQAVAVIEGAADARRAG